MYNRSIILSGFVLLFFISTCLGAAILDTSQEAYSDTNSRFDRSIERRGVEDQSQGQRYIVSAQNVPMLQFITNQGHTVPVTDKGVEYEIVVLGLFDNKRYLVGVRLPAQERKGTGPVLITDFESPLARSYGSHIGGVVAKADIRKLENLSEGLYLNEVEGSFAALVDLLPDGPRNAIIRANALTPLWKDMLLACF